MFDRSVRFLKKSPPTKEKNYKIKGFNAIKRVVWKFVV